jgi:hypothetical protein
MTGLPFMSFISDKITEAEIYCTLQMEAVNFSKHRKMSAVEGCNFIGNFKNEIRRIHAISCQSREIVACVA